MTQELMTRPEARVRECDPNTTIIHLRDRWDGFTFATTLAGLDEQLAIDPSLEVIYN